MLIVSSIHCGPSVANADILMLCVASGGIKLHPRKVLGEIWHEGRYRWMPNVLVDRKRRHIIMSCCKRETAVLILSLNESPEQGDIHIISRFVCLSRTDSRA